MSSDKSWLQGPTPRDHAKARMQQGGPLFLIGVITTVASSYFLGVIWIWTVLLGIAGLFWFLTGLISYLIARD